MNAPARGRRTGDEAVSVMTQQASYVDRDQLVIAHVGLVKAMAHRLAQRLPAQVEMTDLISVGVMGLIDAAGRYKASMGVPFDAFARRRVQGAMLDALRDLDWAPRSLRRMRRELDGAVAKLRAELKREPTEDEVAGQMQMSPTEYDKAMDQVRTLDVGAIRQLDATGEDGQPLLELCIDIDEGPDAQLERKELRALLAQAIMDLPERERQILALYYEEEMTMAEIGAVIGVCESRVSQLRSLALSRLRTSLKTRLQKPEARA
ncbi:sigma-70 family RNA polymerase sigma factor [Luteitalea sp.]|uniref:sigma-70 family RNA polymerase sigma factor n=1 Tax=Luteitalea sp. TaxID=2004800 RepID=UPI0037C99B9A